MKKVIGITIAVFMLTGNLVGCGNSDTEKSKTATATSIETQAETEETVETTTRNAPTVANAFWQLMERMRRCWYVRTENADTGRRYPELPTRAARNATSGWRCF